MELLSAALRAQSISVDEGTQYSFPSPEEIRNLALPNATLANISLTASFLAERAAGNSYKPKLPTFQNQLYSGTGSMSVVVASVLFATLQTFLPPTSSDRFVSPESMSVHWYVLCHTVLVESLHL